MNISNGGPHILLFERDQQLMGLLISEFQLAGYECHTARTAVEVFDAIARYPVRLVLVNLAQAAAARREFWVALDTQRKGRGVQVMTFRCSNIAGYGPRDPEDHSQTTMVDIEIDGMLGVMNLVSMVQSRVPASTVNGSNTSTMPRIPRTSPSFSAPASSSQSQQRTGQYSPVGTSNSILSASGSSASPRPSGAVEPQASPLVNKNAPDAFVQSGNENGGSYSAPATGSSAGPTSVNGAGQNQPTSYTEKIRAVLYPNQRSWSSHGSSSLVNGQENRSSYDTSGSSYASTSSALPESGEATMLQRMANGQWESSLAQLSRLVQERRDSGIEEISPASGYQVQSADYAASEYHVQPTNYVANNQSTGAQSALEQVFSSDNTPATPRPEQEIPPLGGQPLRASPIEDLPIERTSVTQSMPEAIKRTDTNGRNGGHGSTSTSVPPLASITASQPVPQETGSLPINRTADMAQVPTPTRPVEAVSPGSVRPAEAVPPVTRVVIETDVPPTPVKAPPTYVKVEMEPEPQQPVETIQPTSTIPRVERENRRRSTRETEMPKQTLVNEIEQQLSAELNTAVANNVTLLDIVQSLPPMPAPVQQQLQQQVLNGRATRSLGSVLLEGHLVPHSRLEVAQNIQRMLRGVDLNYQLGEILLMFKLLTPDQLLAASLVSYGLITTTQISALGRIRQELHAIGLEYDLENLLILFRILTPEQIREVKSSWQ